MKKPEEQIFPPYSNEELEDILEGFKEFGLN